MIRDFIKDQYHKIQLKRMKAEIDAFEGAKLVYRIRKGWPYVEDADYTCFELFIRTEDGTEFKESVVKKDYAQTVATQYLDWLSEKWGLEE